MRLATNEAYCYVCNEAKDRGSSFFRIYNPYMKRGVSPICKECCEKIYNEYYEKLNRPDAAMWMMCSLIGVPFKYDIWQEVIKDYTGDARANNMKRWSPIAKYLELLGKDYDGFHQSDRMLSSFIEVEEDKSVETDTELDNRRKRQHKDWGEFEDEALDWLDDCFKTYTAPVGHMDALLMARYRDLCKAEWTKRKADESGDIAEINKARDNISSMQKMLHLDNFKGNERSDEDKRIEKITWNIENTEPAECEDLDKYRNFSGFNKTWEDIKRCLQNVIANTRDYPTIPRSEK